MRITENPRKFQQGGPAPAAPAQDPAMAEAPEAQAQDPMTQILQVAAEAVQSQNCEAAMAVCQALMQLAQGGGGPENAPQEEPTFARKGAKLTRVR